MVRHPWEKRYFSSLLWMNEKKRGKRSTKPEKCRETSVQLHCTPCFQFRVRQLTIMWVKPIIQNVHKVTTQAATWYPNTVVESFSGFSSDVGKIATFIIDCPEKENSGHGRCFGLTCVAWRPKKIERQKYWRSWLAITRGLDFHNNISKILDCACRFV